MWLAVVAPALWLVLIGAATAGDVQLQSWKLTPTDPVVPVLSLPVRVPTTVFQALVSLTATN